MGLYVEGVDPNDEQFVKDLKEKDAKILIAKYGIELKPGRSDLIAVTKPNRVPTAPPKPQQQSNEPGKEGSLGLFSGPDPVKDKLKLWHTDDEQLTDKISEIIETLGEKTKSTKRKSRSRK